MRVSSERNSSFLAASTGPYTEVSQNEEGPPESRVTLAVMENEPTACVLMSTMFLSQRMGMPPLAPMAGRTSQPCSRLPPSSRTMAGDQLSIFVSCRQRTETRWLLATSQMVAHLADEFMPRTFQFIITKWFVLLIWHFLFLRRPQRSIKRKNRGVHSHTTMGAAEPSHTPQDALPPIGSATPITIDIEMP